MDQKGILTVDFLLATLLLLIATASIVAFISQSIDATESTELSKAKALSDTVTRSINSVYTDGNGRYISLTLPGDFDYTLVVSGSLVKVNFKGKVAESNMIPEDIAEKTMKPNETWNITNNNNVISFTKIS